MSQYFTRPYEQFGGDINVNIDLSNYASKADLKNAKEIDTSKLAAKSDLASLKSEIDKLDIDKLVLVPVYLSKLSDAVKNDIVKKTVYDKLVAKVNCIDTSGFDTDKSDLEKKIPHTSGLVKKLDYNAKITEIENKIPSISGLATTSSMTAPENKTTNISSLIKKKDYNTKITEIEKNPTNHDHDKYITIPEFNNLAARVFTARLATTNLVAKKDFDDKLKIFNQKINPNKTC